nr:hypothetical protein B0A51_05495 [Rachicladosporium sp. CCFEE 5018]
MSQTGHDEPTDDAAAPDDNDDDPTRTLVKSLCETFTDKLDALTNRFNEQHESIGKTIVAIEQYFDTETDPADVVPRETMFNHIKKIWSKEDDDEQAEERARREEAEERETLPDHKGYDWIPEREFRATSNATAGSRIAKARTAVAANNDGNSHGASSPAASRTSLQPSERKISRTKIEKRDLDRIDEGNEASVEQAQRPEGREKKAKKAPTIASHPAVTQNDTLTESIAPQAKPAKVRRGGSRKQPTSTTSTKTRRHASTTLTAPVATVEESEVRVDDAEVQATDYEVHTADGQSQAADPGVEAADTTMSQSNMHEEASDGIANRGSASFNAVDSGAARTADVASESKKRRAVYSPAKGAHKPAMLRWR